jgi:hypothetical protein
MADDATAAPGSVVKKDVSTAILERKKSPNRLVVGRLSSLISCLTTTGTNRSALVLKSRNSPARRVHSG